MVVTHGDEHLDEVSHGGDGMHEVAVPGIFMQAHGVRAESFAKLAARACSVANDTCATDVTNGFPIAIAIATAWAYAVVAAGSPAALSASPCAYMTHAWSDSAQPFAVDHREESQGADRLVVERKCQRSVHHRDHDRMPVAELDTQPPKLIGDASDLRELAVVERHVGQDLQGSSADMRCRGRDRQSRCS